MQITPHFKLSEFQCRDGAPYPERWIASRLRPLCEQLEILRQHLGAPITISSGYRTPEYNRRIGGARQSQHVEGRAADIIVKGIRADRVHALALTLHTNGDLKLGGLGQYPTFTHLDIRPGTRLARWGGSRAKN